MNSSIEKTYAPFTSAIPTKFGTRMSRSDTLRYFCLRADTLAK
jgi:hypothetical protein